MRSAALLTAVFLIAAPSFGVNSLTVDNGIPMDGSFNLHVQFDGSNTDAFVASHHLVDETTFTARFKILPDSGFINAAAPNNFVRIMRMNQFGVAQQVIVFLTRSAGSGNYRIIVWVRNDSGTFQLGPNSFLTLGASPTTSEVEITWTAATAPGANNGSITMNINGSPATSGNRSDLDTDTMDLDRVQVGAFVGGNPSTHSGGYRFDSYSSFR